MKTCSTCGESLVLAAFSKDRRNPDGLQKRCKACVSEYMRDYYARNKEAHAARDRERYLRDREAIQARHRAYHQANRETLLARKREWYRRNREAHTLSTSKWRAENPGKYLEMRRAAVRRRRARIAGAAINDLTTEQWEAIVEAHGHRCAYCGLAKKLTMDHVVPLSRGGDHTASNVVPACLSCNSAKHAGPVRPYQLRITA